MLLQRSEPYRVSTLPPRRDRVRANGGAPVEIVPEKAGGSEADAVAYSEHRG